MSDAIKRAFSKELAKDDDDINLAYANLLFSEYLTQPFDSSLYLAHLDEMSETVQEEISSSAADLEKVASLNRYLFDDLKFSGNSQDYYHPDNSFLNQVLDVRTGIPIALSTIYLEIGWRLGLPVWGCGLPGHFVVGYGSLADPIYIDVFNQGHILSEDDCLTLCQAPASQRLSFREQFLKPVTKKSILSRMLLNLKQIYVKQEAWSTAYKTVDLMLIVRPGAGVEFRDRGLLAYRLNRLHNAALDLERYLFLVPDSSDEAWMKQRIKVIEEKLLRLN